MGGFFIGDYIEVFAHDRTAWVGYHANDRSRAVLFEGPPIPQAGQTTWPRCGCSRRLAWSEDGPRWTEAFIHRLPRTALTRAAA
jgi:hypothetical protein